MPQYYLLLATVFLAGCSSGNNDSETLQELRSIRKEVAALSDSISTLKDSLAALQTSPVLDSVPAEPPKQKPTTKPTPTVEKSPATPKPAPTKPAAPREDKDTIYHKYVNGKVSVKITPWVDGQRRVLLYDLKGNETFTMEEIRQSYSVGVDLKFAPNGSVSQAVIHTNPGASMYWYETEIKFDTTNEPINKIDHKYPQRLDDMMNEKWQYWDKKSKSWKAQEVGE